MNEFKEFQIEISHKEMPDTYLTETEAQQLCTLAGQLNWMSSQTRPDISYQDFQTLDLEEALESSFMIK